MGLTCEIHRRISLVREAFGSRTSERNATYSNVLKRLRIEFKLKSPQVAACTQRKQLFNLFRSKHLNTACYAQDNRRCSTKILMSRTSTKTHSNSQTPNGRRRLYSIERARYHYKDLCEIIITSTNFNVMQTFCEVNKR